MREISIIAATDEGGGIGHNNQLLVHMPADLKYFKSVTMGKPIIMGRKTYESIGRPLPGRKNIIISSTLKSNDKITVVSSVEQALEITKDDPEIMIIGGAQLYADTINKATRLYITKIHHQFPADVYFPAIDTALWQCTDERLQKRDESNPFDMTVTIYTRKI
jgi:dihydrofolate reductase